MTDVEVLAVQEVATAYGMDFTVFYVIWAVTALVIALVIGFNMYSDTGWIGFVIGSFVGIILGAVAGYTIARDTKPLEYETQYKVIISDEVPMNEFVERYEIISQEGRIYTVRSREEVHD